VIPAFNEAARLPRTLERIIAFLEQSSYREPEIIAVDDGSRDDTPARAGSFADRFPCLRVLRNVQNRGKGYSVRHGMLEARGDWILFTDADLSTPIEEIAKLREAADKAGAAVAIGSRALDRRLIETRQSAMRELSGRAFNRFMRWMTGLPIQDSQCGFKLYRRDAAQAIFKRQILDGFSFDVEDLVIAKALGIAVVETPVRWANVEGTKVSLAQGARSFADVVRIRTWQLQGRYR